ncbi:hypothetical protein AB1Y20_007618 [Prymnesium parvum]|uniref:Endonuclease n=1 Tax=Prymnesium parvum TaxID=97485 RepID=A0AB34IVI4_PRYPA
MARRLLDVVAAGLAGAALSKLVLTDDLLSGIAPPRRKAAPPQPQEESSQGSASVDAMARRICPHGLPGVENLRVYSGFCSSVNFRTRIPNWVAEHLSATEAVDPAANRKNSRFHEDQTVPAAFRASNEDYRHSGLSRGHLAPAGSHKASQQALDETFVLSSNILPQELSNNGSDWLRLEQFAKGLLKRYSDVYIVSGPLFLPQSDPTTAKDASPKGKPVRKRVSYDVIGPHEVAVPTHLFKVIYASGSNTEPPRLSAFVLPNGPVRGHPALDEFVVPLEQVERASGLQLFELLENRHSLPPLCDGTNVKCGMGYYDGRVLGWKLLGHLKLSQDCNQLKQAWDEVESSKGKIDSMPIMVSTRDSLAEAMVCDWSPPPRKGALSHAGG